MGNKKKSSTKKSVVYDELLYMNDKEITAKDISDSIKNKYVTDLWDELGVISFKVNDDDFMDLVEIETDLGTDEGNKYVSDNNIKSIYTVKVPHDSLVDAKDVMKEVVSNIGGLFCMDNEDFEEVVK